MWVRTTYAVQWQMTGRNGWSFYSNWETLEAAQNSMTAAEKVPGVTALRLLERKETLSVLEKRNMEDRLGKAEQTEKETATAVP